ncbi:carboxypeptidase-like regulatory domain-containing protein [Pedobacter metabolipauper]|uniref:TonB-dependent receptor-like protein n=1 Tax=Pedobacter metabolipauper TaxID=425513 RepID=A0A4R6T0T0_9SPHI|nr:carboxypeptidase-like regulatory domain-containing protein [Pedobacter metabolipauper]TDQ10941.1 hypothetical protein ATK78_0051 [Pedobacter metabolipauper]
MNLKRSIAIFCSFSLVLFLAFAPQSIDPVEKIVASLQKWAETNPQEKVYLHTDKPYYVVGDTLWFKAYVTVGGKNQLSAVSGSLYIELINEADSIAESIKLPLTAGMAKGNFVLSDLKTHEGNYRIKAYTQWMRNAGPDYFYDRVFSVGNSVANPVFTKIEYVYEKDQDKTNVIAVLTYTDEAGKPYANKTVRYDLIRDDNRVSASKGETDGNGVLKVKFKGYNAKEFINTHLSTYISLDEEESIPKTFSIQTVSTQTDVQFFPESGNLVNGIRSRVAFKATGTNGLGVPVKGVITDNENNQVAEFAAAHLGMGFFMLNPEAGKTYQAKVTYPDGAVNTVKLPAAVQTGYVLSVYNNTATDTVLVRISAAASVYQNGPQDVSLIAQSGGDVFFSGSVTISKATASLQIPVKELRTGIVQFTLFSSTGAPLNERIIFVQNNDQMVVNLSSAKKVYKQRERIDIDINAGDAEGKPLVGNFSIAVIDESAVPSDETKETTILSQLLLSADVKGYIERPNYYFYDPSPQTKANLDLLMLTQGYRRFVWKDVIAGKNPVIPFKAEKLVTSVSGKLVTLLNKPVAGGNIKLINTKLGLVMDTITDNAGKFTFGNLIITDELSFTVQGRNPKGGDRVKVLLDRTPNQDQSPNFNIGDYNNDIRQSMQAYFLNNKKQDQDLQKNGMTGRAQQLKEVKIQVKNKWKSENKFSIDVLEGHADQTIRFTAKDQCYDLLDCLRRKIQGAITFKQVEGKNCGGVYMPFTRGQMMNVYLNGRMIDICEVENVMNIDPVDVIKIDVIRTSIALGSTMGGASILIYTKSVYTHGVTYDPSVVSYAPKGYSSVKEFYAPKHDQRYDYSSSFADLRSTVYWNPAILTGKDGKAAFSFFNADGKGSYRVVIEGINAGGLLGRKVYRYQVE